MRHKVLGKLTWDEEDQSWKGSAKFPALTPFRLTPHGKGRGPTTFDLHVDSEDEEAPSPAQVRAFEYFVEHEESVCDKVIGAVFRWYARRRKQDRRWFELEECPELAKKEELQSLIEFYSLRIRRDEFKGTALVGLSFGCKWDDEHGLGVLVHRGTILDVGGMDLAFNEPSATGSIWLKVCTPREKEAARTVLKSLGGLRRDDGFPPYQELQIALIGGDRKKIQKIIDKGVDINAVPPGYWHPLYSAVQDSRPERLQLILELGGDLKPHGPALEQLALNRISLIGYHEGLRPAVKAICEPWHNRATEVLRLLREAMGT